MFNVNGVSWGQLTNVGAQCLDGTLEILFFDGLKDLTVLIDTLTDVRMPRVIHNHSGDQRQPNGDQVLFHRTFQQVTMKGDIAFGNGAELPAPEGFA